MKKTKRLGLLPEETFLMSPRKTKECASEKIWIAPDFFLPHTREFFLA
jgi:hypothetical protein